MDQQNIDRLFREKLDQLEVTPSSNAWSQVEKQIRPQKTPVIYWVAASVSLLLISWMVWPEAPSQTQSFSPIASGIDHPVQSEMPEFVIPTIKDRKKEEVQKQIKALQKRQPVQPQFAKNEPQEVLKDPVVEMPVIDVESKTMVAIEDVDNPDILEGVKGTVEKPAFRQVKITYIASSSSADASASTQKTDSTGVIKKFIAFAEKIDPGDVLADIKTAKDNLLNGGLKSKKDRNSL
ncbi:hypothetical protein [Ekhidna sp.]|uniref:hypothetical protein n=1 Tax=Ekhidna sp. TaxID=2608089 RepID=UPI003CCB998D